MPHPVRFNLPDIPQHVTQRGNNRQACFYTNDDYRIYLDLLHLACRTHGCSLHAYVLMTNHVYRRSGTLWEGQYKSSLADRSRYCLTCYRYIELNPVRAGMFNHPADYPWSSFRSNAMGQPDALISPHDCWLLLGESNEERVAAYRDLFKEKLNPSNIDSIRQGVDTGLPTGNNRFRREIEQALSIKAWTRKTRQAQ